MMPAKPPKVKRKKKTHKKGAFLLFILIGFGLGAFFLFREEIIGLFQPGETEKLPPAAHYRTIVLYFSDGDGEFLVPEKERIEKKKSVDQEAKEIIERLIRGPKGKATPTLPAQTRLLNVHVGNDGVAKVSFSKALRTEHPGGSSAEMITVYSIVNSLIANFPEVSRVQILIEGSEIETLTGHLSLRRPLQRKPDLIRELNGAQARPGKGAEG
jgi:spore germination protein GerM